MPEAKRRRPVCLRCGHGATREPRRPLHRLLSVFFSVRYYSCGDYCGWTGLLASPEPWMKGRLVTACLLLALGIFWFARKGG